MATLTSDEIRALADAFTKGVDIAGTKKAENLAYAQADRVQREFDKLRKKIRIEFTDRDPYASFEELQQDVLVEKRMYVFTGFSDTPLWTPEVNWMSRAVHDYDHVLANTDFSIAGEVHAFQVAAGKAPQLEALYLSEIALQAAVSTLTGSFPEGPQRLVIADESVAKLARSFRRNADSKKEAELVWDAAGALRFMNAEEMMMTLGAENIAFGDALALVIAAETAKDLSEGATP